MSGAGSRAEMAVVAEEVVLDLAEVGLERPEEAMGVER